MIGPRSPKQRIGRNRRPEAIREPIPVDPMAHFRRKMRKKACQGAALQTPGHTAPRPLAHQQSQIETKHMNHQSLAHIRVAPDEDPASPSAAELMRERSLQKLATLPLQPSPPPLTNPSPIRVHWHQVVLVHPLPIPSTPIRLRHPVQCRILAASGLDTERLPCISV